MKLLILSIIAAVAYGDVAHILSKAGKGKDAQILRHDLEIAPDGGYSWSYETDNGIQSQASGQVVNANAENAYQVSQGQTSYISPEGEQVSLSYVADENGYQPQGSHIPTPPPIPEPILRALEYIRTHPPAPEN